VKILASSNHDTSTGFSLVRKISDKVVNICNHFCEVSLLTIGKCEIIICGIIIGVHNKKNNRDIRQLNLSTLLRSYHLVSELFREQNVQEVRSPNWTFRCKPVLSAERNRFVAVGVHDCY